VSPPPAVAVVAPTLFGDDARAYLDAAAAALAPAGGAECALVGSAAELARSLDRLGEGGLVLGSLGSELAAQVADAAVERGLVHVEAGAIGDEALGPSSYRLTPALAELARAAAELVAGRRVAVVAEHSVMGRATSAAVCAELAARGVDVAGEDDVVEVLDDPAGWHRQRQVDVVVAALRGSLPAQLVAALASSAEGVETCVGAAGSWTREEVGCASAAAGAMRVVFCEVIAASQGSTLYADLGRAAGATVAYALQQRRPARDALRDLALGAAESPLGYGVRFDGDGRNELARPALLQWEGSAITPYDPGGRA
jgi:ABC-type branched-subunit amino acid transport system substrate-binding protein